MKFTHHVAQRSLTCLPLMSLTPNLSTAYDPNLTPDISNTMKIPTYIAITSWLCLILSVYTYPKSKDLGSAILLVSILLIWAIIWFFAKQ